MEDKPDDKEPKKSERKPLLCTYQEWLDRADRHALEQQLAQLCLLNGDNFDMTPTVEDAIKIGLLKVYNEKVDGLLVTSGATN